MSLRSELGFVSPSRERFLLPAPRSRRLPDLIAVQRESFHASSNGDGEVLADISPIEDFTGQLKLELSDHVFDPPKYSEDECRERDMTYSARCSSPRGS